MSYLGQQLGQGQAERFVFTASGSETSVTTADDGRAIAYTVGQVDVYLNGAKLINGSDFTATTGTSITGLAALTASDVVEVFALSIFQASDTVSAASGGTFNGNITINADLTVDTNTLFVDASANSVGIGTTSPAQSLHVNSGASNTVALFESTDSSANISFKDNSTTGSTLIGALADDLYFYTSTTERMRIDSSGRVGIGTSSPTGGKLQIDVGGSLAGVRVGGVTGGNQDFYALRNGSSSIQEGPNITLQSATGTTYATTMQLGPTGEMLFFNYNGSAWNERARIDSSGAFIFKGSLAAHQTNAGAAEYESNIFTLRAYGATAGTGEFRVLTGGGGGSAASEAMRIDSSGNVGINESSPQFKLDVENVGGDAIRINGGNDFSGLRLTSTGGEWSVRTATSDALIFYDVTSASEAMRIDSSGNLLVGTTTANDVNNLTLAHLFEGASSTAGSGVVGVYNNTGTANCPALVVLSRDASTDSSNRFIQFYADVTSTGATAMGGIVGNGANNVQFATLSDMREKTNIQSISGSLSKINALNPVEFDWIASGEHVNAGFVAQEVEQVFPEFVIENMASEGQEARKGLTGGMTGGIVAHLVKAIQEQQEIINDLRARVAHLEGA